MEMQLSGFEAVIKYIGFLGAYAWCAIMSNDGFQADEPKQGFGWAAAALLLAVYYY